MMNRPPPIVTDDLHMTDKLYPYDPADSLTTTEAIAVFLADAEETRDSAYIAKSQAVAERARARIDGCSSNFTKNRSNVTPADGQ